MPKYAIVEEVMDGGGPVAQSYLDSVTSTSFASLPWGGENAIAFPGLAASVSGQPFPVAYPFYVVASDPTAPEQEKKDVSGLYALLAKAIPGTTSGEARLAGDGPGASGGGARAVTSVVIEGDTVTATGESRNEAISLADGALKIISVRSRSVTTQTGMSESTTETELVVHAATASGMELAFGPQGLVLANQGVPVPAATGLEQFNKALEPFHLSVRIVQPQKIGGGASAAVFEVVSNQPSPHPEIPPSIMKLEFGGATSAIVIDQATDPQPIAENSTFSDQPESKPTGTAVGQDSSSDVISVQPRLASATEAPTDGLPVLAVADSLASADLGIADTASSSSSVDGSTSSTGMEDVAILDEGGQSTPAHQAAASLVVQPSAQTNARPSLESISSGYGVIAFTGGVLVLILGGVWLRPKGVS